MHCMPLLPHGLEVVSLHRYQLRSIDFVMNSVCMTLFRTTNIQVLAECQAYFGFDLPTVQLSRNTIKFLDMCNR